MEQPRTCRPPHPPSPSRHGEPGDTGKTAFQPYIPDKAQLPELTFSAVALGSILGIIFGASSLYLFLKVGMTVSASIPVAVLAITIFRGLSRAFGIRRATILENNIVQTAGSAGESIAFGVGATMPALMLLGYELEWTRVMLVAVLGGLLGILMMIPLRRAFIVKQHGVLPYPEGTACAKVLIVGEQGGSNARTVFPGFGLGFLYQILMQAFKFWSGEWQKAITRHHGLQQGGRVARALADAAGRRLHHRAADRLGHGRRRDHDGAPPGADDRLLRRRAAGRPAARASSAIAEMSAGAISGQYVRYIGAGAVAAGGILSMLNALPLIVASVTGSLRDLRSGKQAGERRRAPHRARPAHDRGLLRLARTGAGDRRLAPDPHRASPAGSSAACMIVLVRVPVRDGQLADHRRDRLVVQPDLRA